MMPLLVIQGTWYHEIQTFVFDGSFIDVAFRFTNVDKPTLVQIMNVHKTHEITEINYLVWICVEMYIHFDYYSFLMYDLFLYADKVQITNITLSPIWLFNSWRLGDAYLCTRIDLSLIQVVFGRLFAAEPFSEPILICCQLAILSWIMIKI